VSNGRHLGYEIRLDLRIVVQVQNVVITLSPLLLLSSGSKTGEKNDTSLTTSLCRRSHTVSKMCLGLALGLCNPAKERRITSWEQEDSLGNAIASRDGRKSLRQLKMSVGATQFLVKRLPKVATEMARLGHRPNL
jgi:hypothetical protein